MSERERFEAIVSSSPYEKSIRRWPDDATTHAWPGSYRDLDVDFAWLVLQDFLARSGQAASGSSQGARSDEPVHLPRATVRKVLMAHGFTIKDGLDDLKPYVYEAVDAVVELVLRTQQISTAARSADQNGVGVGQPEAPTAAPLPENATEPMQKAMQRAVMLRKSMNDVWHAALSELPEPSVVVGAEVERLRQALRDIADPISAWQRDLEEGYELDGAMCVHMSADPETYKRMAREALSKQSIAHPPARSGAGSEEAKPDRSEES